MGDEEKCWCRERHEDHICVLKSRGLTRKVERLADAPGVACLECGETADCADHVCDPMPLFV